MLKTLDEYLQNPYATQLGKEFFTASALKEIKNILSPLGRIWIYKLKCLKRLLAELNGKIALSDNFLVVERSLKVKAYMHDNGTLTLSQGCLLKLSTVAFIRILCHELAHMYMANAQDYAQVKALNRQFLERFKTTPNLTPLTPIEFYAVQYSVTILSEIGNLDLQKGIKKRLSEILDAEKVKLTDYEKLIKALQ